MEPDSSVTVSVPCEKACGGGEEDDSNIILSMISPSLTTPHAHPTAKEKKVTAVDSLSSAAKDAKIDAPAEESSARVPTAQCAFLAVLMDPENLIAHIFPGMLLMRPTG